MRCWLRAARLANVKPVFTSLRNRNARCRNPERQNGLICVVADSRLLALERTREFHGRYHVLGGLISPMDGVGPELLNVTPLVAGSTVNRSAR